MKKTLIYLAIVATTIFFYACKEMPNFTPLTEENIKDKANNSRVITSDVLSEISSKNGILIFKNFEQVENCIYLLNTISNAEREKFEYDHNFKSAKSLLNEAEAEEGRLDNLYISQNNIKSEDEFYKLVDLKPRAIGKQMKNLIASKLLLQVKFDEKSTIFQYNFIDERYCNVLNNNRQIIVNNSIIILSRESSNLQKLRILGCNRSIPSTSFTLYNTLATLTVNSEKWQIIEANRRIANMKYVYSMTPYSNQLNWTDCSCSNLIGTTDQFITSSVAVNAKRKNANQAWTSAQYSSFWFSPKFTITFSNWNMSSNYDYPVPIPNNTCYGINNETYTNYLNQIGNTNNGYEPNSSLNIPSGTWTEATAGTIVSNNGITNGSFGLFPIGWVGVKPKSDCYFMKATQHTGNISGSFKIGSGTIVQLGSINPATW